MTGAAGLPAPDHSEAYEELAVGWALHALEPQDAQLLAPHLEGCARCRQVVDETTEVMAVMATGAPPAEPPPALGRRLMDAVAATPQRPPGESATGSVSAGRGARPSAPPVVVPAPRRRWTAVPAAAALAAVVALGGWTVVLVADRDEARATAAELAAVVDEVLRPGPATVVPVSDDAGRRVATVVTRDDELQVVSHGLAVNDRDAETYVLWGLDGDDAEPLDTFDVTDPDVQLRSVAVDGADAFDGYGVSIEPGRRAPDAPTDVVATGSL